MVTARTRLSPDRRRAQLLDIGARLFAERPYDEVWIDEVADLAGVSSGLMYHYFHSKRDFFAEIIRVESARLIDITAPDAALPAADQISAGLRAYIEYVRDHEHGFRAISRGGISGDTEIQATVTAELALQQTRILTALGAAGGESDVMAAAIRGWVSLVRAVCLDWVDRRSITETQVHDLCMRALHGLISTENAP